MITRGNKIKCKKKPWGTLYIHEGKTYEVIDVYLGQVFLALKYIKIGKKYIGLNPELITYEVVFMDKLWDYFDIRDFRKQKLLKIKNSIR